jgi:hypothetical protein
MRSLGEQDVQGCVENLNNMLLLATEIVTMKHKIGAMLCL